MSKAIARAVLPYPHSPNLQWYLSTAIGASPAKLQLPLSAKQGALRTLAR
jgi:hypothetical protein